MEKYIGRKIHHQPLFTSHNSQLTATTRTVMETSSQSPASKRPKLSTEATYDEVTLQKWQQGYTSSSNNDQTRLPLIDLRSKDAHAKNHLNDASSTIVHLPFDDLLSGERSCELPPRHVEFAIIIPADLDRNQVEDFFFATCSKATSQSRKPWLVRQVVQETNAVWEDATSLEMLSSGDDVHILPLPRLWKPDQMVEKILFPLLKQKLHVEKDDFVVWDLGSGAGRDVSFLAEELKHQTQLENSSRKVKIVGFDNHKGSSRRSLPLWKNRMVGDVTESRLLNLKNIILLEEGIREENGLACVYAIRYLNRRMIDYIATDAPLKSGCLFAMSHFCKEAGAEWNWDHPKVRNCRVMYSYFSI